VFCQHSVTHIIPDPTDITLISFAVLFISSGMKLHFYKTDVISLHTDCYVMSCFEFKTVPAVFQPRRSFTL